MRVFHEPQTLSNFPVNHDASRNVPGGRKIRGKPNDSPTHPQAAVQFAALPECCVSKGSESTERSGGCKPPQSKWTVSGGSDCETRRRNPKNVMNATPLVVKIAWCGPRNRLLWSWFSCTAFIVGRILVAESNRASVAMRLQFRGLQSSESVFQGSTGLHRNRVKVEKE